MTMSNKMFEIEINWSGTEWGTVYAMVEAETAEEARALFDEDPHAYDWDGWETYDSELRDWDVESVDVCPDATKKLQEKSDEV
jgi:hypothetical protein